uniref:VDE lipocalin domain-containing protein n=1 Tax=Cacopsylla melanoneura TaxID=428564 RepID=A0A8D8VL70_9HEMI
MSGSEKLEEFEFGRHDRCLVRGSILCQTVIIHQGVFSSVSQMTGVWYVVQYYASSEEALAYRCMQLHFFIPPDSPTMSMNFTYIYTDDPDNDILSGNITWRIPDTQQPAHWVHAERIYEGVYNTYVLVLDPDHREWTLLLHCAEKANTPRYLSSFIMGKQPKLPPNVLSYLREKLPKYGIDLEYMFEMTHVNCDNPGGSLTYGPQHRSKPHPMGHHRLQEATTSPPTLPSPTYGQEEEDWED